MRLRSSAVLLLTLCAVPRAYAGLGLELGGAVHDGGASALVLLDWTLPAKSILGTESYYQLNGGAWTGNNEAATIGIARGLRWGSERWGVLASLGLSLVSQTSNRLATSFEFYEQLAVDHRVGGLDFALGLRHWSNGGIKQPNGGMTFLTAQVAASW